MINVLVTVALVASDVEQQVQGPAEQQSQDDVHHGLELGHGHVGLGFFTIGRYEDFVVFHTASVLVQELD